MDTEKGISIIVPCYNVACYVEETVASVCAQPTKLPYEILLIDDCSTDKTLDVLYRLEQRYPNVRVIKHEKNQGVAAARNTGLVEAKYTYIFPLDPDDKLSVDPELMKKGPYLDRAVQVLERDSTVAFAYCKYRQFGAVNQNYLFIDSFNEKRLLVSHNIGSMIVFRRQEGLALGGYNEKLLNSQDWDFNISLLNGRIREGKPAQVERFVEPYHMYRKRGDGTNISANHTLSKTDVIKEIIARNPEIYAKHFPGLSGELLVNHVLQQGPDIESRVKLRFAFYCLTNPVSAASEGAFHFAAERLGGELKKIWARHAPAFGHAKVEPHNESHIPYFFK